MLKVRIIAAILATVLVLGSGSAVLADSKKVITFQGEAGKFVTQGEGDLSSGFTDMEPGQQKTQKITLKNNDYNEMKFYMSGKVLSNIADNADKMAIYTIDIRGNGENFFHGIIGSEDNKNLQNSNLGLQFLQENFLLAALKKGESMDVDITIELDGDSAGNDYQAQQGEIQLTFSVDYANNGAKPPDPIIKKETVKETVTGPGTVITKTQNVASSKLKKVKTGDESPVGMMITMAAVSTVAIAATAIYKRKKKVGES